MAPTKLESVLEMLKEIIENDQKQQEGYVAVAPIAFWTQIFAKYFLHVDNPNHDDMLFYVKKADSRDEKAEVVVHRRESTNAPGLGDPAFDWTETVYLNMILQQLEYTLICAICTKKPEDEKDHVSIHKKVLQQVYASPSKHNMEAKGKGAELCYPNIFFTVDNFDQVWSDLHLAEGQMVCVEIVASDKSQTFDCVIFLGSVNHSALSHVYNKRTHNGINSWAKKLGWYNKTSSEAEFVRMKGPGGKGYAEMAIHKSPQVGESDDTEVAMPSTSRESAPAPNTTSESLQTQLTYVTLPWHKIVLDILQRFEKPQDAKRPVFLSKS